MWIWKTCALEKIHFHTSLETANRQNESPVSEDCRVRFPLFSDLRFSVVNDIAKLGHRFAGQAASVFIFVVVEFDGADFRHLRDLRVCMAGPASEVAVGSP